MNVWLFIFLQGITYVAVEGAALTCTDNLSWGYEPLNVATYTTDNPTSSTAGYIMETTEYHVPDDCSCGVLKSWTFIARSAGSLTLQVWQHDNSEQYTIRGANYFTVPSGAIGKEIEFQVPQKDRITIRNNYLIAWLSNAQTSIIAKRDGLESLPDEQRIVKNMNALDPFGEGIFDWSAASANDPLNPIKNTAFAIRATAAKNTAPEFTNLPRDVWIYGDTAPGTLIYSVSASDIDPYDVSSLLITYDDNASFPFYYDRTRGNVYLGSYGAARGTYNMTFTVTDQCGNTNSAVLTIKVLNWAPKLHGLPAFYSITEETVNELTLATVNITDRDNTTWTTKTFNNDSNLDAELEHEGFRRTARNIVINKDNKHIMTYSGNEEFFMKMSFTDGTDATLQGHFMLYVIKNSKPKFTNLNNGAKVTVSYLTTSNGDFVYAVSTSDDENDHIYFDPLTCDTHGCASPCPCPFAIGKDGIIHTTQDFMRTYITGYDVTISMYDDKHSLDKRTATLTILVEDIDDKPQVSNLPMTYPLGVSENTPLGTTLYTVLFNDLDSGDTHTIHANFSEKWATSYFHLNETSGVLTTAFNVLDYEKVIGNSWSSSFNVAVQVNDGMDWSDAVLSVVILNVNEPPSFHETKYKMTPAEQGDKGSGASTWGRWMDKTKDIEDQDLLVSALSEAHTFTWDCGESTRFFLMDRTTGDVTFSANFDYDTANLTTPFTCTVKVKDKAGMTATTLLEVLIDDANDNAPVFAQTTAYYIFQVPDLAAGRFVGQVTAADSDRSTQYSNIYYSFLVNPFLKGFMVINDFGNIYVNETWKKPLFAYGVSYDLVVLAENVEDHTGTRHTSTASVTVFISGTSTTTTTTTDRPAEFLEDTRSVSWISVLSALGGTLLLVVVVLTMAYTVQVKRYRWCIPWCRKKLLGLGKMTRKEKRRYYRAILRAEAGIEEGDEEVARITLGEPEPTQVQSPAPPMMWDKRQPQTGPTVRKSDPVLDFKEPKPPLKPNPSKMMTGRTGPKIWT
ncbi:hypothetical protein DPMN_125719 [Dreissena polymorpha]|uniref:Cadherin domain-containing protein n=2 Tax=Dreissena polymorpha TaxID=45954 RepID=A0A9D4JUZ2_DREPO|nr:hypothetical protein DPMN_125719 [Dreissena polymorpha]